MAIWKNDFSSCNSFIFNTHIAFYMKNTYQLLLVGVLLLALSGAAWSQSSPNCATASDNDFLTGKAFFNYGSLTGAFNTKNRANLN